MAETTIFWFRQDLRLTDLPGLCAAAERGAVLPVFIHDPSLGNEWSLGGASQWWLHYSLKSLQASIEARGGELILRRGAPEDVLTALIEESGASAVYSSRQYQPWATSLETTLHETLTDEGIDYKRYAGTLLFEPGSVLTGGGTPYKVFTPFWRACLQSEAPREPRSIPDVEWHVGVRSESVEDWNLRPSNPNWADGWESLWSPGEEGATRRLDDFLAGTVKHYGDGRDIPAEAYTSRLSPHLKFGEISPRQIWHAAQYAKQRLPEAAESIDKFLSEIGWREFCYTLLDQFPEMPNKPFKAQFDHFPWAGTQKALKAWQKGLTGYPIVDAGMRELWQTGFMHNRVRMITGSFLTKHLLTHWRAGELWFWDCLVDADIASNACSWQWVAGSGADASPYFRIFNPIAQGEKFDKAGEYVRRYVPEIANLPDKYIHKPWEAPASILEQSGIVLGDTYPEPIVDHKSARQSALAAYEEVKNS
ncbi:deoxyribodipyrimidine photo-lyase [Luminiphilus syltensis NOR5-1B]|uniref:Deoxyribodipyrimidine photo-lyase n=1 Tax=Luminiphilus syltensis NOR5-1B TaxID=565045 RepID=B8KQQ2_9GAMM|nr:deoxyribodipyrimidine photo-lyase [Luminiphilus syltensis]EED36207.1 deoxyribodipyrimidine photo-lyase [Luminiphilus syltensis NOR5-1B]